MDRIDATVIMPAYSDIYGKIDVKKMGFAMPFLGGIYIAEYLRKMGKKVDLFDAHCTSEDIVMEALGKKQPRFVGFSAVTPAMPHVIRMARLIREICPDTKIVVGGFHPSALPRETIQYPEIDIVVIGEGEESFNEIIENNDLSTIKGICYIDGDGKTVINPGRDLLKEMDDLPFLNYDELPREMYGYTSLGKSLAVISGRGCPYRCTFCASKVINTVRSRFRSAENFVDELAFHQERYGCDSFAFFDDTFTTGKRRVMSICDEILKRGLNIRWSCCMRADHSDEEMMARMKQAGCRLIEVGVETADETVMKSIGKKISLPQVRENVRLAKKYGIEVNLLFILGLPYDTVESVRRTIDFAKTQNVEYCQFAKFTPLPGTTGWDLAVEGKVLQMLSDDWGDFARYRRPVVTSKELPAEMLEQLHQDALREYYLRPTYILQTLLRLRSLPRLISHLRSAVVLLKILFTPENIRRSLRRRFPLGAKSPEFSDKAGSSSV